MKSDKSGKVFFENFIFIKFFVNRLEEKMNSGHSLNPLRVSFLCKV